MSHTAVCFLYPHAHPNQDLDRRTPPAFTPERTRSGLRAVGLALLILGITAVAQAVVFLASGSVALFADLIHNVGDALTAVPVAIAFLLRSRRAERRAGVAVVIAIAVSAVVAGYSAIDRLVNPREVVELVPLAAAGVLGVVGNWLAAVVRSRAGERLGSPALIADGAHAAADAYVSLAAVASAALVALGWQIADPILGLALTLFIGHIAKEAWETARAS